MRFFAFSRPIGVTLCLCLLVACGAAETSALPTTAPLITEETAMPEQSSQRPTLQVAATLVPEAGTPSTASTPFAAAAIADLAQRHSADPAAISVLEVRDVVWPDRGLGCPQPGMAYTQVPVDGLLIRLQLGGQVYEYHSGGGKAPFLCEQPAQPGAGGAGAGGASQ